MARSVARYLVAAFAFMAAATWVGISLTGGFTCLLVFVLTFQAVRLYRGGATCEAAQRVQDASGPPGTSPFRQRRESARGRQLVGRGLKRLVASMTVAVKRPAGR